MTVLVLILAILAFACFVLAALNVVVSKVNLIALGLAVLVAAWVCQYTVVGHLHYLHR